MAREAILIADDDKAVVMLVSELLRKNGFHVVPAYDSMQAMVGARQTKPRLVILDISMPGGSGMDVLKKLKTMSTTKQIPVLILTGNTDAKMKDLCMDLGAADYLAKPVDLPALLAAINGALGRPAAPPAPTTS